MDMDESINAWYAAVRAAHIAACVLILGVWIFDRWIVAGKRAGPLSRASEQLSRRLMTIALPTALLSGVAWFFFVADGMRDPTDPMRFALLRLVWRDTQFGHVWQLRGVLWVVVAVTLPFSRRACSPRFLSVEHGEQARRLNEAVRTRRAQVILRSADWITGVCAAAFLATLAWAGHGATGPAPAWHRAADVVHLLSCGAWLGGLIPLALLLRRTANATQGISIVDAARMVQRFSAMSLAAVVVLSASGVLNAWCLVGSFPALWSMPYGRILLAKLGVFLVVIVLGAINLLIGKPRLIRIAEGSAGDAESRRIIRRIMWSVTGEAVLGFGILGIVGLLGLLAPARM